jgi:hypothetical protein
VTPRHIALLVEGQTERAFVDEVLAPYLAARGTYVTPVIVATARAADGAKFVGGGSTWGHYERDIRRLLASSHFALVSIIVDFYGYPHDGPGASCAVPHAPRECVQVRQEAMAKAISDRRFLPHIVLHEFETWVIAAAVGADRVLGDARVAVALRGHAAEVADDVELLNDSPQSAPSKRVLSCWPDYQKVLDGVAVIAERGLDHVMRTCPALRAWVDRLA